MLVESDQYNIGYICTTQQCNSGFSDKTAFRWLPAEGDPSDVTFKEFDQKSNKFANVLSRFGFNNEVGWKKWTPIC